MVKDLFASYVGMYRRNYEWRVDAVIIRNEGAVEVDTRTVRAPTAVEAERVGKLQLDFLWRGQGEVQTTKVSLLA